MEYGNQMAGVDWKGIFQSIPAGATATAMRAALVPILGSAPILENHGDYYQIRFTPEQEERLSAWILTQIRREPGPVRVDASGVVTRVLWRQYWPYALGLAAVGGLAAYMLRKGR